MASMWDPWHGCHKCSDGCLYCYIHKGDAKRGVNTDDIVKTAGFSKPIEKKKNGDYKMPSGLVYVCFSSDFLIEEADSWRKECWQMIKERKDCTFLFLTKRIDRFLHFIPDDWGECHEELAITLPVGDVFMDVVHEYPDIKVHLTLLNATIAEGIPQKLEHNDIRWIMVSEIPNYEFCPADDEILREIKRRA